MLYSKIDLQKLYEQEALPTPSELEGSDIDKDGAESPVGNSSRKAVSSFAFPVNQETISAITAIGKKGEWKSPRPLNVWFSADKKSGGLGEIDGLPGIPVFLKIRIGKKGEQLNLNFEGSETHLLWDMKSIDELTETLKVGTHSSVHVPITVVDYNGDERTLHVYSTAEQTVPSRVEPAGSGSEGEAMAHAEQLTSIQGTTSGMNPRMNEEQFVNPDGTQMTKAQMFKSSAYQSKVEEPGTSAEKEFQIKNDAAAAKPPKHQFVYAKNGSGGTDWWYVKGGQIAYKMVDDTTAIIMNKMKVDYAPVDKAVAKDKAVARKGMLMADILKKAGNVIMTKDGSLEFMHSSQKIKQLGKGKYEKVAKTETPVASDSPFKDQASGDAFRLWANSKENIAKFGKDSKFDLDAKGKFNNSFINKSYAAAEVEGLYTAHLAANKDAKYKKGDLVYWKVETKKKKEVAEPVDNEAGVEEEDEATTDANTDDGMTDEERRRDKGNAEYGMNPPATLNDSIAHSFDTYMSITEEGEDGISGPVDPDEVDLQANLLTYAKDNKLRGGNVIAMVDDETVKVSVKYRKKGAEEVTTKEEVIKISDIVDTEKAKKAKAIAKAEKEKEVADKESSSDIAKNKLNQERKDTKSSSDGVKDARKEKRATKGIRRNDKKQARKSEKEAKIRKKTKKIKDKPTSTRRERRKSEGKGRAGRKAKNESTVFTFDQYMKSINS
jgi:hypothetical protein